MKSNHILLVFFICWGAWSGFKCESNSSQSNIFEIIFEDDFFHTYQSHGRILFSIHYYSEENFCSKFQIKSVECVAEEVDSTKKYVELIEYMEVEDQIRIQLKCHAPNELFDKLYSCLYQKEGKRYVLKSKFIDET